VSKKISSKTSLNLIAHFLSKKWAIKLRDVFWENLQGWKNGQKTLEEKIS